MTNQIVDLSRLEGSVYTGRDRGQKARDLFEIDRLDASASSVLVKVPDSTISISSSFFLGLFGKSVTSLGSRDLFFAKYKFEATEFLLQIVEGHVGRALEERELFTK